MKKLIITAALVAAGTVEAAVYGDIPDSKHAWSVHDWNRPKPSKVEAAPYVNTGAPSDAIVLFDGTKESFEKYWCDKDGKTSQWKLGSEGDFYCVPNWKNGGNIFTRGEYGDCQFHIEYRHEADITDMGKGPQMRGNSGVFFMGPSTGHEVQVLESFFTSKEMEGKPGYVDNYADGQAGAVYAENPPAVNPARKPGEWQVYDIVFHQPIFEGEKLIHPGSLTVFFNGVLVQDHWEMEGITTHKIRKPLRPHPDKGQLMLQDHGCTVHFRNIWLREIPSRWANKTHSNLTADETEVKKLRSKIATELYAKIADKNAVTIENVGALAEVISYAREGEQLKTWKKVTDAFHKKLDQADDKWWNDNRAALIALRNQLDTVIKGGMVPQQCGTRRRISAAALRLGWEK